MTTPGYDKGSDEVLTQDQVRGLPAEEASIFRKTQELYTLRNRLRRYWRRLTAEGILAARNGGIDVITVHGSPPAARRFSPDADRVHVYETPNSVDTEELMHLAEPRFPSLYRRYFYGGMKYDSEIKNLDLALSKLAP